VKLSYVISGCAKILPMEIEKVVEQNSKIRSLTTQEYQIGRNVMEACMYVQPSEKVLIVTDPEEYKNAAIFFEAAKEFTDSVKLISFSGMHKNAQEPPPEIVQEIIAADVAILITKHSLTHTKGRLDGTKSKTRIATMPGITQEIIMRTLGVDYSEVAALSIKIANILTKSKKGKLTAEGGTDITFSIAGRAGIADTGLFVKKGAEGNLPAGEAFIAPLEGTTNGIIVFDGSFDAIELNQPIITEIQDGKVISIKGGKPADILKRRMDSAGEAAYNIAELGIGTNSAAELSSNLLEAEKVFGTVHVAMGSNITFGGTVSVPFHSDGVILSPTLKVDDILILDRGSFRW